MVNATLPLVLRCSTGSLTLALDERGVGGWCQVHLVAPDAARPLGAERLSYITAQIVAFLSDAAPGPRWVASFAELHVAIYGEHLAGQVTLGLQDARGNMFARLALTPTDVSQWLQDCRSALAIDASRTCAESPSANGCVQSPVR